MNHLLSESLDNAIEFSELVADAIIARVFPVKDDISEREAKASYGARWLDRMKKSGLAESYRIGGKIIYSRHQLDCLRLVERTRAQLLMKKPRKRTNNTI